MKVLIAMDSFKGSLSSLAAGEAIRAGLLRAMPKADAVVCPLADGGEGTAEALTAGLRGGMVSVEVFCPEYWKMTPQELIPLAYRTTRAELERHGCL